MKLNSLQSLSGLGNIKSLPSIKPLTYKRVTIDRSLLSEVELILYSANLCLFSARILRNEIQVNNREGTLNAVTNEVTKLYSLLSRDDYYQHSTYTHKDTKKFYKYVGLKPKHIKH